VPDSPSTPPHVAYHGSPVIEDENGAEFQDSSSNRADSPSPASSIVVGVFLFVRFASILLIGDLQLRLALRCLDKGTPWTHGRLFAGYTWRAEPMPTTHSSMYNAHAAKPDFTFPSQRTL